MGVFGTPITIILIPWDMTFMEVDMISMVSISQGIIMMKTQEYMKMKKNYIISKKKKMQKKKKK